MSHIISQVTRTLLKQKKQEHQLEQAQELGVRILSLADPEYPRLLRLIPSPPPLLYVKGHLPSELRGVACVGTRYPTTWGHTVTERITHKLVEEGYTIISGLALGIDRAAHSAALVAGGQTIGVLPCGLDAVYPSRHQHLAERIIEQLGALISEQPFGGRLHRGAFVKRNRIQSGLALATVVMQSVVQGGTMHTARFCQKQGRLLCVIEPQGRYALESKSQGNLVLLKESDTFALRSAADYPRLLAQLEERVLRKKKIG